MTNSNILENIKRLENTIASESWNKGYVANCKAQLSMYKEMLAS